MKIQMKKGKVIGVRKNGKLVRCDYKSGAFSVKDSIGKSLIKNGSAVLVDEEETEKKAEKVKTDEVQG